MFKKIIIAFAVVLAVLAAVAAGGYGAYIYGERETLGREKASFIERVGSFGEKNGVECFNETAVLGDNYVGWFFFRFDENLYFGCEYVAAENDERALKAEVINMGQWFPLLAGGDTCSYSADGSRAKLTLTSPDGTETARIDLELSENGLRLTSPDYEMTLTQEDDFDTYIPPVVLMAITPEEPAEVLKKSLLLHLNGDIYSGGEAVLSYNGSSVVVCDWVEWLDDSFVVPADDGFYVLVTLCYSNDWLKTALVHYSEADGLRLLATREGGAKLDRITEDTVRLSSRISVFGTYDYYVNYSIGPNGLVQQSKVLDFENDPNPDYWPSTNSIGLDEEALAHAHRMVDEQGRRKLTLKKDAPCFSVNGLAFVIPAESVINPTGINPSESKFFFEYGGSEYYFIYAIDEESWSYAVDGVSENKLFEQVDYVG